VGEVGQFSKQIPAQRKPLKINNSTEAMGKKSNKRFLLTNFGVKILPQVIAYQKILAQPKGGEKT